jgi:LytS/YehU family sensor histidine kinase
MLLQPLVENSIKHGLESGTEGGTILIRAVEADAMIGIEVRNAGRGFSSIEQPGIGISNVRKRFDIDILPQSYVVPPVCLLLIQVAAFRFFSRPIHRMG